MLIYQRVSWLIYWFVIIFPLDMRNAGAPSAIVVSGCLGCLHLWQYFSKSLRWLRDPLIPSGSHETSGCLSCKEPQKWMMRQPLKTAKNGWCGLMLRIPKKQWLHSCPCRFTCADPHGFAVFIKHQSHCRTLSWQGGVCSTCCWNTFASCDDKRNKYTVRFSPKRKEPAVDNRLMQSLFRIHCGQYLRYLEIMGTQWYRPFGVRFLDGRW